MNENPYQFLDDKYHIVNFSGGRSSGFMLWNILQAHGGTLPKHIEVIFCNTGKERPETLDFVNECGKQWGVPITWLEYDYRTSAAGGRHDPKNVHKVVDYQTASRNGLPFDRLLIIRGMLPNPATRFCTSELKIETVNRYLRRTKNIRPKNESTRILGIRFDEKRRIKKIIYDDCDNNKNVLLPMVQAKHDKGDVTEFWNNSNFDLNLTSHEGNCDLCFMKGRNKTEMLIRMNPDLANWWVEKENQFVEKHKGRLRKPELAQFSKNYKFQDLVDNVQRQDSLPGVVEEIVDGFSDVECFCTD